MLRTVYIEPAVDARLRDEALRSGMSTADLFRRYLRAGVRALKAATELEPPPRPVGAPPLLLRTVHIDAKLDDWLRTSAFDAHVLQSDYLRWCLDVGMQQTL